MVYDTGCPWTAYHVHATPPTLAVSLYDENRVIYPCCNYGGNYFQNNIEAYWTFKTQFWQGH